MAKILLVFGLLPLACFSQEKEKWIDHPKEQWPQIALINRTQFKNGDRYVHPSFEYAATGFLIDNGKDTLAATAKHVLWIAKNTKSKTVQVNRELKQWVMRPKGSATDSVVIDRLLNEDSTELLEGRGSTILERDWIVFSVKNTSPNIYPLKPRYTAILPGEKVYMLSCAYKDSACRTYEGKVLKKLGMDIIIEFDMKEPLAGSSGSAIIDANGYLIGIQSSFSSDEKATKPVSAAVSTEYLHKILNKKHGLNNPKKDYGELILKTVLNKGTTQAIQLYTRLTNDPQNYYIYNLRSADRNGLRETGKKLIELNRFKEAVEILKLNVKVNSGFYVEYNLLAKAHLLAGNKNEAIKNYQISIAKYDDKENNEAFKELEKLKG
jgi:tetratricopeptide (TPR) repeat protein